MPDEKDIIIADLRKRISELEEIIKELREQLNKNSGNSSKPPSTDGFKKPVNKNRSLRKKSGKKPGGQIGHTGSNLSVLSEQKMPSLC